MNTSFIKGDAGQLANLPIFSAGLMERSKEVNPGQAWARTPALSKGDIGGRQ